MSWSRILGKRTWRPPLLFLMHRFRSRVVDRNCPFLYSRQSARRVVPDPLMLLQVSANFEAPAETTTAKRASKPKFMRNCMVEVVVMVIMVSIATCKLVRG